MSTLVGSHLRRPGVPGWVHYCGRLDLDDEARKKAVPVTISDMGEPWDVAANIETLMKGTTRTNGGESLVMSFPAHEMDVNNPEHQLRVGQLAYEHAKRAAPNSPAIVFVHTDSKGGKLHAHVLVVNHDLETGRSNQSKMDIKRLRRVNDGLMREEGLEICSERDLAVSRSWAEIIAERETELDGADELVNANPAAKADVSTDKLTVDDALTRETTRQYIAQEINDELTDLAKESSNVTPESLAESLYDNRQISMRILPDNGYGHTITYGAVGEDGKTVRNSTVSKSGKQRNIKVAAKDKQMGAAYSYEGIEKLISQRVEYYDRQRADDAAKAAPTVQQGPDEAALRDEIGLPRKSARQRMREQLGMDAVDEPQEPQEPQEVPADTGEAARRHRDKTDREDDEDQEQKAPAEQPTAPTEPQQTVPDPGGQVRAVLRRVSDKRVRAAQQTRTWRSDPEPTSAHRAAKVRLRELAESGELIEQMKTMPPDKIYRISISEWGEANDSPQLGQSAQRKLDSMWRDTGNDMLAGAKEKKREWMAPRYAGPDTKAPKQLTAAERKHRDLIGAVKDQKAVGKDNGRDITD